MSAARGTEREHEGCICDEETDTTNHQRLVHLKYPQSAETCRNAGKNELVKLSITR